jgi:bifunctional non-homologous end joining protein LigD
MRRSLVGGRRAEATALPSWVKPQLTKLVDQPPDGPDWLHEIKFDGYRMHARLGAVRLLTRTGLVQPDGTTSFSLIQTASDAGNAEALVFFLFDLLHLDGETIGARPLTERKERLRQLLSGAGSPLHFSDHQVGRGQSFYENACGLKLEGIVSKRAESPYAPAIAACGSRSNA